MKILYVSCHSILEYDEVSLLTELGYNVFSAGAYSNPMGHPSLPRPGIPGLTHYPDLEHSASTINVSGGAIPDDLIAWADTVIFMHQPAWIEKNWHKLKSKRVIYRAIGQSLPHVERLLQPMVAQGLQIVRYSPNERNILDYAGEHALIRFYKDPEEYKGYTGSDPVAINFTQSLKQRAIDCHYEQIMYLMKDRPHKVYGNSNEALGEEWGGEVSHEEMKRLLRESRVYIYGGTWPASYTLSFIEALMTGIPMICIGKRLSELDRSDVMGFYEVPSIIQHGVNGFVSDELEELKFWVHKLLQEPEMAKEIGERGRQRAIELFGKEIIKEQWQTFLGV